MKQVDSAARGFSDRQWAKYTVIIWCGMSLAQRFLSTLFLGSWRPVQPGHSWALYEQCSRAIEVAFKATLRYYQLNKGTGKDRIEISVFFKRRDV